MSNHVARLSRLFTPYYTTRINSQIVYPSTSQIVKPNELLSALARPLHVATYEPERSAVYLAATLSYGLIKGHPFLDGNKRTAFFIANEYLRGLDLPGLTHKSRVGTGTQGLFSLADLIIDTAAGKLSVEDLARGIEACKGSSE